MSAIVVVEHGGSVLKSISGNLLLNHAEPCTFSVVLSNHDRDYGPGHSIAQTKATSPPVITIKVKDAGGIWISPDLLVESYRNLGRTVTISGSCRLSQLELDDQFQGQFEDVALSTVLDACVNPYGLTVANPPSRTVGEYTLFGNPLSLFKNLVWPLETFKMGAGTAIQILSAPTGGSSYTDRNHLKAFQMGVHRRRRNKAIVERLERGGGRIELAADSRSGPDAYATSALLPITPSRQFQIEDRVARANAIWTAYDENEDPVGASPLANHAFRDNTPAHFIRYSINIDPAADSKGPWERSIEWTVWGVPAAGTPDPVEGYSKVGVAGDGSRPYQSPFSLASVSSGTEAQAAADAISSRGERESEPASFQLRLTSAVPEPYTVPDVTDFQTEFSGGVEIQTTNIAWNEKSPGQNGIEVEGIVAIAS